MTDLGWAKEMSETASQCHSRCLFVSELWALELLGALNVEPTPIVTSGPDTWILRRARAHIACKEYFQAANLLKEESDNALSNFLYIYARNMAWQKSNIEGIIPQPRIKTEFEEIVRLARQRLTKFEQDPFCLLMLALVCRFKYKRQACDYLESSIRQCPFIFTAWEEYASLLNELQATTSADLGLPGPIKPLFEAFLASQGHWESWDEENLKIWCKSDFYLAIKAKFYYRNRKFAECLDLFAKNEPSNPFTAADVLSDVYYLLQRKEELYVLARRCLSLDKHLPETSYVNGNFYALIGKHEQAALCFRRAIRADPKYALAWVLIGHQYVELRQPEAAIDSFVKATELCPRDYRPWHSLGMIYELMDSPSMAAPNYARAVQLRPDDPRLWSSLADCYGNLGMTEHALLAYRNALKFVGHDPQVKLKLGMALRDLKREAEAATTLHEYLIQQESQILEGEAIECADTRRAIIYVYNNVDARTRKQLLRLMLLLARSQGLEAVEAKRALSNALQNINIES